MRTSDSHPQGLTLVELLMTISLMTILAVVGIATFSDSLSEQRFNATVAKLEQIRIALVGDPQLKDSGARNSFGYWGDVGALPSTAQGLAALLAAPAGVSAFATSATNRIGVGWRGPYATAAGVSAVSWTDGWGNALTYSNNATTVSISSLGADNAAGGTGFNQDLSISLTLADLKATLRGFVSLKGSPISSAAEIKLFQPDGVGAVQTVTISIGAAAAGYFSQANVPFGRRSATVYIPSSAAPTTTLGPVTFTVDRKDYEIPANLLELSP